MRFLIGTLLLASCFVGAHGQQVTFRYPNEAGGQMLLTTKTCADSEDGRIIISSPANGYPVIHGCAYLLPPDQVYISWDGGETTVLPSDGWTPAEAAPRQTPAPAPSGMPARIYQ